MASNKLEDLNDMLFNQLVRLDKDDISDDELKKEINRSHAMTGVAHTIIDNARVVLSAAKFMAKSDRVARISADTPITYLGFKKWE